MKLSKARLRQIIKEELMAERIATVPQVQQMAAQAGVRLSYGDAKALAARTPAERGALMSLQQAFKNGSWRQMINEITDLPLDYDTPASDQEREMDELSAEFEEIAKKTWFASTMVRDPLGGDEPMRLDEFLALLGNRVVSGEIDKRVADHIVSNVLNYLDR
tara:strand:- start:139 stop:624 length:486 start_codon:yes stop_codon:yes gene_type:complete